MPRRDSSDPARVLPRLRDDFETSPRLVPHAVARATRLTDEAVVTGRLLESRGRGQAVGQITLAAETRQSSASKHLQVLYHAGLVRRRRDVSTVFYSLGSAEVLRVCGLLGAKQLV